MGQGLEVGAGQEHVRSRILDPPSPAQGEGARRCGAGFHLGG